MRISSREKNKIKFNEDHTNYINSKGEYIPSVTTILKVLAKDDSLMIWANNLGWKHKSYKKELENSSIIGTTAHAFCESMLNQDDELLNQVNDRMNNFSDELYDQTNNCIQSFKKWYFDHEKDIKVISTELQLSNEDCGGTTDLVCKYKGKRMLFDYKTSSSFYMSQFLQLSCYAKMYKETYNKKIEDVAILRLDKKYGDKAELLRLSKLPNGDLEYYQHIFDKLINIYKYNNILNNDWNEYKSIIYKGNILE